MPIFVKSIGEAQASFSWTGLVEEDFAASSAIFRFLNFSQISFSTGGGHLGSANVLKRVVDLPHELDGFTAEERVNIDALLVWAKECGADQSYIAQHRKAWWPVGLKAPAPVLCTYMARRPPQFTVNACGARHINIAHGLYPRENVAAEDLARLVNWLNQHINTGGGRTYAGGLMKFEPKEIERLRIPRLDQIVL